MLILGGDVLRILSVEVSHDILAAIIGALAIVLVAVIPRQVQRSINGKQDRAQMRSDLISLRERLAELSEQIATGQERRRAEHQELREMLRWFEHKGREQ